MESRRLVTVESSLIQQKPGLGLEYHVKDFIKQYKFYNTTCITTQTHTCDMSNANYTSTYARLFQNKQ